MTFKDIVVHQGEDTHAGRRLNTSLDLAEQFNARLTGVYVQSYPTVLGFVQSEFRNEIIEQLYNEIRAGGESRRVDFNAAANREDIISEFRLMEGDGADAVAMCGRYSDQLVVGQPDLDYAAMTDGLAEALLLASERPILVVPYTDDQIQIGRRVMIAWRATREATRAVHDTMPMLEQAEEVIVYSVNPDDRDHLAGAEICTHLARHGVNATLRHIVASDLGVADCILSAVADNGIDLFVMVGYGHSRLRELAFGGATREILHAMTYTRS
ncbi:MAG: universal stress protein [Alphaproteobacteria bacterium]